MTAVVVVLEPIPVPARGGLRGPILPIYVPMPHMVIAKNANVEMTALAAVWLTV